MNRNKFKYTIEEKRAILAIVDAYQHYRAIRPPKKRVGDYATESILCVLLGRLSGRMLELDSWRRNVKRWRAELEPVPFVPVDPSCELTGKTLEVFYRWPDGREEVRYRRPDGSPEAVNLINQVDEKNRDNDYSYGYRIC
jgi:hypothetical protein